MAGKKSQKRKLKKASKKAANLAVALTTASQTKGMEKALVKKEAKALATQARFNATVNKTNAKTLRKTMASYLRCLANPVRENACRVPDGFPRRTALLHSLQTLSVMPNNADSTDINDKGRFAFCISPTIAGSGWLREVSYVGLLTSTGGVVPSATTYLSYAQGCKVAYLNPASQWDPATAFQDLTPAPKHGAKVQPAVGPPIPTNNQWIFQADPNATAIAGTDTGGAYFENGAAESIRPVAMSVWLQRDASSMLDGGECAIALMAPDSVTGNVVPYNWVTATTGNGQWSGQGPIMNVENLAMVPGAYSGPLRTGAYAYWVPHRQTDVDFKSVLDHVMADFPWIMVAGKAQTYDQGEVARIVINTVWEYTTVDQTRETRMGDYDPEALAILKHILRTQPTAMANDEHVAWWKHLLKIAASAGVGFLSGGPAGAVAGAAGYALGNL
jgi:hypothetical protein